MTRRLLDSAVSVSCATTSLPLDIQYRITVLEFCINTGAGFVLPARRRVAGACDLRPHRRRRRRHRQLP